MHRELTLSSILLFDKGRTAKISNLIDDKSLIKLESENFLRNTYAMKEVVYQLGIILYFMMNKKLPDMKALFNKNFSFPRQYTRELQKLCVSLLRTTADGRPTLVEVLYSTVTSGLISFEGDKSKMMSADIADISVDDLVYHLGSRDDLEELVSALD